MPTKSLVRRNVRTKRHSNDGDFIGQANAIDQVLSRYGLIRVDNPGSVSWKLPSGHDMAGVAGAELTFEGLGRSSFGFNEDLAQNNPQIAQSGLFRSAFKVIPRVMGLLRSLTFVFPKIPRDSVKILRRCASFSASSMMRLMRTAFQPLCKAVD